MFYDTQFCSSYNKEDNKQQIILLINDKVCRCQTDRTWRCHQLLEQLSAKDKAIESVFIAASTYWYDPKYGIPLSYKEMKPDHRAEVEHILVNSFMSGDEWRRWEVIGRLVLD